jgi:hypothetical protein
MFVVVLMFAVVLWVLTQLRQLFRSLSRGLLFIPENARRLSSAGFAVMFGELARVALVYVWSSYSSAHFEGDGIRFVPWTDVHGITIVAGLAILVIAEVFREGTRLHEEQSLTV